MTVIDHGGAVGRRVYLAYWDSGLIILNAEDLTPGTSGGSPCTHPRGKCKNNNTGPSPIIGPNVIDPAGFLTHHAFASYDGSLVFIQDEFMAATGDMPVQMWDISVLENPFFVDGLELGVDLPENPAHNLEIRFDINPDRLYSGWYKLGLQAWDFSSSGFVRYGVSGPTSVIYHQVQTELDDNPYSGAWGVRLEVITTMDASSNESTDLYLFQSDRNYGLIIDRCTTAEPCIAPADPPPPPPPPPGDPSMHVGGLTGTSGNQGARWKAAVTIWVHDDAHELVADATVFGQWSNSGSADSCTTGSNGQCSINLRRINGTVPDVTFTVNNMTHATLNYVSGENDSENSVTVSKPQ